MLTTEHCKAVLPQNPMLFASEIHKTRWSPGFEALKLWNVRSDSAPPKYVRVFVRKNERKNWMQYYFLGLSLSLFLCYVWLVQFFRNNYNLHHDCCVLYAPPFSISSLLICHIVQLFGVVIFLPFRKLLLLILIHFSKGGSQSGAWQFDWRTICCLSLPLQSRRAGQTIDNRRWAYILVHAITLWLTFHLLVSKRYSIYLRAISVTSVIIDALIPVFEVTARILPLESDDLYIYINVY